MSTQPSRLVVIKFGGNALTEESGKEFCRCVAQLPSQGISPVIVHGGGPQINDMLDALSIKSHFVNGLRYTDKKTLHAAEMVLSGHVNKMLVQFLGNAGAVSVGLSGKDGKLLIAEKMTTDGDGNAVDLGYVGSITSVRPRLVQTLIDGGYIPVIAPLAYGEDGESYNINADYAAAALARALNASNFIMMTNIDGLLDGDKQRIVRATKKDIHRLIADNIIQGGMIPKTLAAIEILSNVGQVNIIDGRMPENLIKVLSGTSVGTTITQ